MIRMNRIFQRTCIEITKRKYNGYNFRYKYTKNNGDKLQCLGLRQFSNSGKPNNDQTTGDYLSSMGYDDPKLQEGMKDALNLVFGKNLTVANLKSLGKEGELKLGIFTFIHVFCRFSLKIHILHSFIHTDYGIFVSYWRKKVLTHCQNQLWIK